jgi:hypothetical protein
MSFRPTRRRTTAGNSRQTERDWQVAAKNRYQDGVSILSVIEEALRHDAPDQISGSREPKTKIIPMICYAKVAPPGLSAILVLGDNWATARLFNAGSNSPPVAPDRRLLRGSVAPLRYPRRWRLCCAPTLRRRAQYISPHNTERSCMRHDAPVRAAPPRARNQSGGGKAPEHTELAPSSLTPVVEPLR